MNKIFSDNIPWKVSSLILAAILWIFVINSQNPMQPYEIKNVPIVIKGLTQLQEKGFVLKNQEQIQNQRFKAVVKGPRLQIDKIATNNTLVTATLDLAPYLSDLSADSIQNIAQYAVNISIDGISLVNSNPEVTNVILEKEKSVIKNITYKKIGEPKSGYMDLDPIIKPDTVEIKGAQSDIERIAEARVEINIDKFSQDVLIDRVPIKVFDSEGQEIENLKKSPQLVDVKLPIGKTKTVPLEATFKGTLPKDYVHTNTLISPKTITIVGKEELVDQIQKIQLKEIQLDNLIQTSIVKTEMVMPKGIEYIDNIDKQVDVTVEIKKENTYPYAVKTSNLDIEVIGLDEQFAYEMLTPELELVLKATAEELITFNADEVVAKIDLTGFQEGEYTIPIALSVPDNFIIMNAPINVNISLSRIEQELEEQTVQE